MQRQAVCVQSPWPTAMLCWLAPALLTPLHAATLNVGPGQTYTTIAAAIAASQDGDTILVQSGQYLNDFAEITTQITLLATGGRVEIKATIPPPNLKGILVIDTDVSIIGFTFDGAAIPAQYGGNGAGIRHQGGHLTLNQCWFHNNQDGILSTPQSSGATLTILASEFSANGVSRGALAGYEHNIYAGALDQLDIENSYIHDALVGHEVKSRAAVTIINNSRIVDGPRSTSSYSVDLPNGGVATITNTQIEQGPNGGNSNIIAFGEEGGVYANSSLTFNNVLLENDENYATPRGILNATSITATVTGLTLWGMSTDEISNGALDLGSVSIAASEPKISRRHPWLVK